MSDEPQFYSVQRVAEIFAVGDQAVRNWIKSGKIKAIKVSDKVFRIERAEVLRFANEKYGPVRSDENDG